MSIPVDVVVMAAGRGTRMKSARPKVLHRLGGKALALHVLECAAQVGARQAIIVTGHEAEQVERALSGAIAGLALHFVRQEPQIGTGHAVMQAMPHLANDGITLVLSGDVPLTRPETLKALIQLVEGDALALLTLDLPDSTGYGRIVRNGHGEPLAIVEHPDATAAHRSITEVYSGIMAVPTRLLRPWLARLDNRNAQGEYYLTDVVKLAVADGVPVRAHRIQDAAQVLGVNTQQQLTQLERIFQARIADDLMTQGVHLADPARLDVRGTLSCGQDVEIDINGVFEGQVTLGHRVRIGANCFIANTTVGDDTVIHPFTHIDGERPGVTVGTGAQIGPFARLRPGAQLGADVHIGNFVEVKNSTLAAGAKANHLAYLGDATVGERVNFGAGSITANYDGAHKHRTVIEADVHVGSNCVLVAPVTLGSGGTVGGGSTVTQNTAAGALTVARARQVSVADWSRPKKS